jgi:glycosyltransferase involved in cell wall biosynthesis
MAGATPETPALSVVIPVYDEEESVRPLYEGVRGACDPLRVPYEMIFVDDGSGDRTFETLAVLHGEDARVRVIRFRRNYGQTAAMAAGFGAARGATVVSLDGDLQNDPADIPHLLAKLDEGFDVVCGWRKGRQDTLVSRRVPSAVANWLIAKITGVSIHDNGCSLRAYRAPVIKQVELYADLHRFIPALSTLTGARIAEIVVRHHPRRFGRSKYGLSRAWRVFLDLFLIKMLTGFAARPALWFGTLSLPTLLLGTLCLAGALMGPTGIVLPGLTFLCFSLAGHFLFTGALGELVLKTGDFRPERTLARITIRERRGGAPAP